MSQPPSESDLEWVQMVKDIDNLPRAETQVQKFVRKFKQNPFVPIGCLATAGALTYGLWSFRQGRRKMSQIMMRTRVVAQGFTVTALVLGVLYGVASK
ncbi:HIG1 domain family member 2A, mitochondrial [Culicoides brevitarsis]|uniref:HIG1 domain family member 2A, mitochondrial n=1 Tax=Culicoides brevitarsis TaxID=469753 RepID=UPI00307CAEFC